jgi:hypothetical protein
MLAPHVLCPTLFTQINPPTRICNMRHPSLHTDIATILIYSSLTTRHNAPIVPAIPSYLFI